MHGLLLSGLIAASFLALLFAIQRLSRLIGMPPELQRKAVHVGTGLVSLSFPWLFPSGLWFIVCMAIMLAVLLALRLVPRLRNHAGALHGVERRSLGDLWFLAAVAALYFLSQGNPLLYVIPLTILTVSDALAAVAGTFHGRHIYSTYGGTKSWEGTFACFASALGSALCLLLFWAGLPPLPAVLIAVNLALAAAIAEGIAGRGLDNLLLPLMVHGLLSIFIGPQDAMGPISSDWLS